MNLDALYKMAERFEFTSDADLGSDARFRSRLDPHVRSPSPEQIADFSRAWRKGLLPAPPAPSAPPRFSGLRRWGGRATRWGLLGSGALAAGNYLWGKVPDRFTVTPEEAAAQRRPGGAPSKSDTGQPPSPAAVGDEPGGAPSKAPKSDTGQPPSPAAVGDEPVSLTDQPSSGWDSVKDGWSNLPTAAKWGIGATGAGLATYLLYRLLRNDSDDR